MSGTTNLRVAVIGLGGIARNAHMPVLAEQPGVTVVAVCDPSPLALAQYPWAAGYATHEELLEREHIDAAFVLTPEHLHYGVVRALLERGVAVLCEKPLAPTLAEATDLAELATRAKVPLFVGFNRRFAPVYVAAKAALIATPPSIGVFEKTKPERGYRGSVENLVHMVDLARFFFGECAEIAAFAQFDDPYWEESLSVLLRFETGQVASIVGNRSSGVWTERVDFHGGGTSTTVLAPDELRMAVNGVETVTRQSPIYSGFDRPMDTLGFTAQASYFFEALRRGDPLTESAASALRTQELMDRILRTAGLPVEDARASTQPQAGV